MPVHPICDLLVAIDKMCCKFYDVFYGKKSQTSKLGPVVPDGRVHSAVCDDQSLVLNAQHWLHVS